MSADAEEFGALVADYRRLGSADRRAVLAQLSSAEREAVPGAMAAYERARHDDLARARRAGQGHAAYSPWLAKLVRSAESGDGEALTDRTARAVVDAHRLLVAEAPAAPTGLLAQLRQAAAQLFAPLPGDAS